VLCGSRFSFRVRTESEHPHAAEIDVDPGVASLRTAGNCWKY